MKIKYAILLILFFLFGCVTTSPQSSSSRYQPDYFRNCKVRYSLIESKLQGPFEFYEPNGQLQIKGNFVDNKKEGLWVFREELTGVKLAEITYKDGLRNGPIKLWYSSFIGSGKIAGHKKLEAFFLQGNYHGIYKIFVPDGKISSEVEFDNGNIKQVKHYDYDGNLVDIGKQEDIQYGKHAVERDLVLFESYDKFIDTAIRFGNKIEN